MIVKPFSQIIEPEKVFNIQNMQYSEIVLMADEVPAASSKLCSVSVSNLGHFFCRWWTGAYETIIAGPPIADSGVSYLSGQLVDGAGQRKLFNDYIPFELLFSPGRRKSADSVGVLTDPVGNQLFFPIEFEYLFSANSSIQMDVKNSSTHAINFEIAFFGIRLISDLVTRGRIPEQPQIQQAAQPAEARALRQRPMRRRFTGSRIRRE